MSASPADRPSRPRVRPWLRRTAILLLVILLPLAAHGLWDYLEVRRLVHEIERIQDKSEPVSTHEAGVRHVPPGEDPGAGPYYLAAAMLVLGSNPETSLASARQWLAGASGRESTGQVAEDLHRVVEESREALALADQAARRPFTGFAAGTEYSYRAASLGTLSKLITARTLSLSLSGRGDEAVDSAIAGLKMRNVLRDAHWLLRDEHQVAAILSLSRPSAASLRRLQAALEDAENQQQPVDEIMRERARYIEMLWRRYYGSEPLTPRQYTLPTRSLSETIWRPWFTHRVVTVLRLWAELVEQASAPWPQRIRAGAAAAERFRQDGWDRRSRGPSATRLVAGAESAALPLTFFSRAVHPDPLILDRTSRVAIAVERFRHDHGGALPGRLGELVAGYLANVPDDPYSGGALLYDPRADTYAIYSVGPNLKDDGGDFTSDLQHVLERGWGRRIVRGADVGIRVRIRN